MKQALEAIEFGYQYPVTSAIGAIQAYNEEARAGKFAGMYDQVLQSLLGDGRDVLGNDDHARIQVGYVIQLAVEANMEGVDLDDNTLYTEATKRAHEFIVEMPWVFATKDEAPKLDAAGNAKPKKGAKQIQAYEVYVRLIESDGTRADIIQAFQDEVGLTIAGATTYFYNTKKKYAASQ